MKARTVLLVLATFIGLAAGFWLYGGARTMQETVGLDISAFLVGLFLSFILPLLVVLPPVITAKKFWLREKVWSWPAWVVAFALSLFAGSLASEAWILADEARFAAEVPKRNSEAIYHRARAWPNQNCSLLFVPGAGIHSTD